MLELAFERYRNPAAYARATPVLAGHGHGCGDLLQMVEFASLNKHNNLLGMLSVISQKARYTYLSEAGSRPGVSKALAVPLEGTLLEWRIKI